MLLLPYCAALPNGTKSGERYEDARRLEGCIAQCAMLADPIVARELARITSRRRGDTSCSPGLPL